MRYPVVIQKCYRGLPLDEEGSSDERKRAQGEWFVTAFVDGETYTIDEIPVDKNLGLFEFDFTGHGDWMPWGFLDGDEKRGLRLVETNIGPRQTAEWSWDGGPLEAKAGKHFWEADSNFFVIRYVVRSSNEGTYFGLYDDWDNYIYNDAIGETGAVVADTPAGTEIDWRGESGDLVYYLAKGHALSVDIFDPGVGIGPEATVRVIMREIVGQP